MGDEAFDRLVALLNYTMFVVTTQADGHTAGCLVGFATQTSLQPPRFLVGVSRRNRTFRVACQSEYLAVHVLARRDIGLARLFGGETGDETNKFEHCSWHSGPADMPILDDAVAWFVGKTRSRMEVGDHMGYLLEPIAGYAPERAGELIAFSDLDDIDPGHEA
jgi:flavin reductase (DIM6/NTAB) family NADH-FMN oxidoreductase RutF